METTKEQFKRIYSAFRLMERGGQCAHEYVRRDFNERLARLPRGAQSALRGKRQAPALSRDLYDGAEKIFLKAEEIEKRMRHNLAALRVVKSVQESALDRMALGEKRHRADAAAFFFKGWE